MKKSFFLFFFIFFCSNSFSEDKIIYLDVNFLINESEAGKFITNELQKINDKNIDEFKIIENSIKSEETKLIKQKNILKEDEFKNKANKLRDKYKAYQELKIERNKKITLLRDNSSKEILKVINIILTEYSNINNISLIIDKKIVVIGKTDLDVTQDILKLLNKKINKVELINE